MRHPVRPRGPIGQGRITAGQPGSPGLGPDVIAATARGVKVGLALTQSEGPLQEWLDSLASRRLTYFLSSNVAGWKYTEFAHPGSLPFNKIWLAAPGGPDCEICGTDRIVPPESAGTAEFTCEPPPGESVEGDDGLFGPVEAEQEEELGIC